MYKLLKDSLKIRRYLLVTILVIQFISVILSTLLPYMNGMFVDMLIDIKNVEEVIKYAITIAGVGIISLFLSYIYNLKIMKVKNNISFEINSRGILHLQKIPLEIEYPVDKLCKYLNITRSAYYHWLKHPKSNNELQNETLSIEIQKIHKEHPDMGLNILVR